MVNAIIPSVYIGIVILGSLFPLDGFRFGDGYGPLTLLNATIDIQVAEMRLTTLLGVPVNIVYPCKVYRAHAMRFSGAIRIPWTITSWVASSERIEVGCSRTPIITLLVGREAKSGGAVALARPYVPYAPSAISLRGRALRGWVANAIRRSARGRRFHRGFACCRLLSGLSSGAIRGLRRRRQGGWTLNCWRARWNFCRRIGGSRARRSGRTWRWSFRRTLGRPAGRPEGGRCDGWVLARPNCR